MPVAETKNMKLGEILIERKKISADQLNKALEEQKKSKFLLGEILVQMGFLEERDIVVALILQCEIPYIAVEKYQIDRGLFKLIPKEFAAKNLVIPLDKVGGIFTVVMTNPLDSQLKADIERLTQSKVLAFIATKTEILKVINQAYGA